jgi:uncharacterized protein YjbI with pentapeptide repeats
VIVFTLNPCVDDSAFWGGGLATTDVTNDPVASWWQAWIDANYSWDGLAYKSIAGDGGIHGEKTLQDYWRRLPEAPDIPRTDEAMRATGELIAGPDGRLWHIAHLPPRFPNGNETWKADLEHANWKILEAVIAARLAAATKTTTAWRSEEVSGKDGRAQLCGNILLNLDPFDTATDNLVHVTCERCIVLSTAFLFGPEFGSPISFAGSLFMEDIYFGSSKFAKHVDFRRAVFLDDGTFNSATFLEDVNFSDAVIGRASFANARFAKRALFMRAKFLKDADFSGADFVSSANFGDARFDRRSLFVGASFSGVATFRAATFGGSASFAGSPVNDEEPATEQLVTLKVAQESAQGAKKVSGKIETPVSHNALKRRSFRLANFENACFEEDADFSNRTFLASTKFGGAVFNQLAQFHDSKLHQDTSFAGATFLTPQPKAGKGATAVDLEKRNTHFEAYERAYRTLKLAMEGHRARREEARFFRKELEARRMRPSMKPKSGGVKEVTLLEKGFSHAYEATSGFGESLLAPIYWLIGLWAIFSLIYGMVAGELRFCSPLDSTCVISPAVILAGERTWLPFVESPVLSGWWHSATAEHPFAASMVGIVHRILATILIFLLALAARRKFQIS